MYTCRSHEKSERIDLLAHRNWLRIPSQLFSFEGSPSDARQSSSSSQVSYSGNRKILWKRKYDLLEIQTQTRFNQKGSCTGYMWFN